MASSTKKPSNTAMSPDISVTLPEGSFTLTLPSEPRPGVSTMRIHPSAGPDTPAVPMHWHETHTEYMRVLQGYMILTVGGRRMLRGPDDGPIEIAPFTPHSAERGDSVGGRALWTEAQRSSDWPAQDVVVEEWAEPLDGGKELFFRNLLSRVKDDVQPILARTGSRMPGLADLSALIPAVLRTVHTSHAMDTYYFVVPVSLGLSAATGRVNWLARAAAYSLGRAVGLVAVVCGWSPWIAEYTPVQLQSVAKSLVY